MAEVALLGDTSLRAMAASGGAADIDPPETHGSALNDSQPQRMFHSAYFLAVTLSLDAILAVRLASRTLPVASRLNHPAQL
ncbi:hypothetical protein [Paracoccus acridae]|uniref:hypothetical protein n=1 Tax=Paracoccus acridae TaxID=1795310 RepID=UPI001669C813|nr:hypothetical protein [Paracoccus acridae]